MKMTMCIVAAVTLAWGAEAGSTLSMAAGTGFEVEAMGEFVPRGSYWAAASKAVGEIVTNGVAEYTARPELMRYERQVQYLEVSTSSGFTRYAGPGGTEYELAGGFCFDSLVRFSAAPRGRELADGEKLAVWLKSGGEGRGATLTVTAGGVDADGGITTRDYEMTFGGEADWVSADEWHRLTITTVADIFGEASADPVAGFVIFVDGRLATAVEPVGLPESGLTPKAVCWARRNALVPGRVRGGTLSGATFVGKGAVDDLVFTPDAPEFAQGVKLLKLVRGEHVASVSYRIGREAPRELAEEAEIIELGDDGSYDVTVEATYDEGFERGEWKLNGVSTVSSVFAIDAPAELVIAATAGWDIPGARGGIRAFARDGGKEVEFTSIVIAEDGISIGVRAAELAADGEEFGLVCKSDPADDETFIVNARLECGVNGSDGAAEGRFTLRPEAGGVTRLFVVGVGPARSE